MLCLLHKVGFTVGPKGRANPSDSRGLPGEGYQTMGFSGGGFDEVRLQATTVIQALALDNISATSGVPEPSTWAMMLLSFAGLSYAGYWRARDRPFGERAG